jgi:hypothetical protein
MAKETHSDTDPPSCWVSPVCRTRLESTVSLVAAACESLASRTAALNPRQAQVSVNRRCSCNTTIQKLSNVTGTHDKVSDPTRS